MASDGVVAVRLEKQVDKDILYGDAALTVYEGFTSLDVVGHYLPDLSDFGPEYDAYSFLVIDPETCTVVTNRRMTLLREDVNDWVGALELGLPPHGFGGGMVVIYPTTPSGVEVVIPVLQGTVHPE